MDPVLPMKVFDGFAEFDHKPQPIFFHDFVLDFDEITERHAFHEFHHEKLFVLGGDSMLERLHHMGVLERDGDFTLGRLFVLHLHKTGIESFGLFNIQQLQGDGFFQAPIDSAPDL